MKKIFLYSILTLFITACGIFSGCAGDKYKIALEQVSNVNIYSNVAEAKAGDEITLTYDNIKNGYEFVCFTLNGAELTSNKFIMPSKNITISAIVSKINYTITYHLDNDTTFVNPTGIINTYTIGTNANLPTVQKHGNNFDGWYTDELLQNPISIISSTMYGNLNLYPKFIAYYSITYHYDGQVTNNNPTSYNGETGVITLTSAIKTNYEFMGWYDNANFTGNAITQIPAGTTGNINLYAKFVCTKVEGGYRLITNEIDFVEIMSNSQNWSGKFKLTSNLDLENIDAFNLEIGEDINNPFTGEFDGNNKTISNITFENPASMPVSNMKKYAGLFNYVYNATIKNVNYNCNIDVRSGIWSNVYVGGLIGFANGNTQIVNCHVSNSSITYKAAAQWLHVGSITGNGGVLSNCSAKNVNFDIESICTTSVGGLVGQLAVLDNCKFENSANNYIRVKTIEDNVQEGLAFVVGGLVGHNGYGPTPYNITNCYVDICCSIDLSNMSINGNLYLGGLVGISKEGATNSYSHLNISAINVNADQTTQRFVNQVVGFVEESTN